MIIGILSILFVFIVTTLSIFKKLTVTHKNKRTPTRAGWILIVCSIITLGLQITQVFTSEGDKQVLQDSITSKTKQVNQYTDQSNKRFTKPILDNQKLNAKDVDTVKRGMNSANIKLTGIGTDVRQIPDKVIRDAEFFVTNIAPRFNADSFIVDVYVMAKYNTATEVNTDVYPLIKLLDGSFEYLGSLKKMRATTMMQDDRGFLRLSTTKKFKSPISLVFFKIVGTFKTRNKTKVINNFIRCDVRQGFFDDVYSDVDADMVAEYKKHNIIIP